jgi:serine/threonine protein kinase
MDRERWQRLKELFGRALELLPAERETLLVAAEAEDRGLREELESLLLAHSEDFLERPLSFRGDFEESDAAPEPAELIGKKVAGLRFEERIAVGGLGEVYRAVDLASGSAVAVKRLVGDAVSDPNLRARFRREARAAMALRHANVVTVHRVVEWMDELVIVMNLIEGRNLRQALSEGPFPLRKALDYAIQLADGLTKAHELGIIHRDVKQENVMVTFEGTVKLVDFGIVKLVPPPNLKEAPTHERQPLSREGVVLGSASYMSPEQVQGLAVDGRSDVFALGALLYEMATGTRAFAGAAVMDVVAAVLRKDPSFDRLGGLAPAVRKALEKDPARRFPSMAAFRDALGELR